MKKKLLEKDGFYLALFVCICLVAIGGVWFTKNNVDELTSNDLFVNKTNENSKRDEDEVHLIEKEAEELISYVVYNNKLSEIKKLLKYLL